MNLLRTILLSIVAGVVCLAGPVAAKNTQDIIEATRNPARGGFALLAGDINQQQLYIVFSATTGGDGVTIVLPVKIDGQTGTLDVAFAAGGPAGSTTLLSGSVVTLLQGSVVTIDHTLTVTGTVTLADGTFVSINHTLTVTGTVTLAPGTVVSIDHTLTVTGSVEVTGTVATQEVANLKVLEFSFTPLTALYQVGDTFGPVTELTLAARISGGGFMIHSVSITDSDGNNPDITVVLSDQTFTVTGDGTPFDPDDTEVQQFIGKIKVIDDDWEAYSVNGEGNKANLGQLGIVDGTSLFVALVINTNTTYPASQTIRVRLYVIQE